MIRKLTPHICIILSLVTLTFLVLNQYNPSILGKSFFQVLLLIYSVATIITSAFLIADNRRV
jgi:hypothetical protein